VHDRHTFRPSAFPVTPGSYLSYRRFFVSPHIIPEFLAGVSLEGREILSFVTCPAKIQFSVSKLSIKDLPKYFFVSSLCHVILAGSVGGVLYERVSETQSPGE
jgi:hypothetical protein